MKTVSRPFEEADSSSCFDFSESGRTIVVYCDASLIGWGGVLMQHQQVLAYASR